MSLASRTIALLALAAAVTACAGGQLPPPAGTTATAAPEAAATPQALVAGTYATQAFSPTLTFTVPDGWELVADTPAWIQLRPQGSQDLGLYVFRDAYAASQDATCPATPADGVGTTSTELVSFFRGLPGVVSGTPALVTIGGLRGSSLDLGIVQGWTQSCPFAEGVPTVPLIMNEGIDRWVLAGGERLRFWILDLPGGGNVVVDADDFAGTGIDDLIADAAPIVRSFSFAAPVASPDASPSPGASAPASQAPSASPASGASPAP